MGPERQRRFAALVLVTVLLLLTTWLEDDQGTDTHHSLRASVRTAALRLGKALGGSGGDRARGASKGSKEEAEDQPSHNAEDGDDEPEYSKTFRGKSKLYVKTPSFQLDLHACLPRFICEVHATPPGTHLTTLEEDIVKLFRYVVLEGPTSPVYSYQLAAHMGQLLTGLEPSPCYGLYPSCPLSRHQLLEVLASVKSSRKIFM